MSAAAAPIPNPFAVPKELKSTTITVRVTPSQLQALHRAAADGDGRGALKDFVLAAIREKIDRMNAGTTAGAAAKGGGRSSSSPN